MQVGDRMVFVGTLVSGKFEGSVANQIDSFIVDEFVEKANNLFPDDPKECGANNTNPLGNALAKSFVFMCDLVDMATEEPKKFAKILKLMDYKLDENGKAVFDESTDED